MIHEEICTYEVCKLAKEKGFNEYEACNHIYEDDEQWYTLTTYTNARGIDWSKDKFTVAPTQSLLQRWLREEKGLHITVPFDNNEFWWQIKILANGDSEYSEALGFSTYELALKDALKYALENLM
jgi:hypothetical protein